MKIFIKKIFIRNFYRIANPIRKLYWLVTKTKTRGVKCLIKNGEKFLLIRNSYGSGRWTIPGGGFKGQETEVEAVCREVKEEVGIFIKDPILLGVYEHHKEGRNDKISCFLKEIRDNKYKIDPIEISEANWFLPGEIPNIHSFALDKALEMYHARSK